MKINIETFIQMHGCNDFNAFAIGKKYAAQGEKTYQEWHSIVSAEFSIGAIKVFEEEEEDMPVKVPRPKASSKIV